MSDTAPILRNDSERLNDLPIMLNCYDVWSGPVPHRAAGLCDDAAAVGAAGGAVCQAGLSQSRA